MPKGIHNKPPNLDILDKRYKILSDDSGHDYIVEDRYEAAFYKWVDAMESDAEYIGPEFDDRRMTRNSLTFIDPQGWK
jgi:hypothetical protein